MKNSNYMEWAKTKSGARFSLATSGVKEFPFRDLKVRLEDLELRRPRGLRVRAASKGIGREVGCSGRVCCSGNGHLVCKSPRNGGTAESRR